MALEIIQPNIRQKMRYVRIDSTGRISYSSMSVDTIRLSVSERVLFAMDGKKFYLRKDAGGFPVITNKRSFYSHSKGLYDKITMAFGPSKSYVFLVSAKPIVVEGTEWYALILKK